MMSSNALGLTGPDLVETCCLVDGEWIPADEAVIAVALLHRAV